VFPKKISAVRCRRSAESAPVSRISGSDLFHIYRLLTILTEIGPGAGDLRF
jgi:hypothetical protein